jgi:hypothetical protein
MDRVHFADPSVGWTILLIYQPLERLAANDGSLFSALYVNINTYSAAETFQYDAACQGRDYEP